MPKIQHGPHIWRIGASVSPLAFILAFLLSDLSAQAQNTWTPLPNRASWAVDSSWGPGKGGSRFASGSNGNPYLSMADSLFYGNDGGKTWTGVAYQKNYAFKRPMPVAVGSPGHIAWGNQVSSDSGHTWILPSDFSMLPSALCLLSNDGILAGRIGDEMFQSADLGKTWVQVIKTMDFGTFLDIQPTMNTWVFAAPQLTPPQFSRDNGLTWTTLRSNLKSAFTIQTVSYMALETRHYQESVWLLAGARSGYPCLVDITVSGGEDSLNAVQTWIFGIPEDSISAFAVWNDWGTGSVSLWLGTWGAGVFVSKDRGKTWKPDNSGLGDPFVEDLWVSKDGAMLVLTKAGMFRRDAPISSPVLQPLQHKSGMGQRLGFSGLPGSTKGKVYRLDGRTVVHRGLIP
jgi:hypothetical protein